VRIWSHGFQGPSGRWYIENSLTTLNLPDPVSEFNTELWNTGIDSNKEIARKQKRKLTYIANILVIKDAANPDNEGKVFLYKFGKKIFDKIKDIMQPQFEDEDPTNPFDFWKGANFKLKIRKVEGYRNYDKSEFDGVSSIADNDEAIEDIWNQQYGLQEFVDPKNFKSYDELQAKLMKVLGEDVSGVRASAAKKAEDEELPWDETPAPKQKAAAAPKQAAVEDDDDESLEFFKNLANA
jgi:hypothetical protein